MNKTLVITLATALLLATGVVQAQSAPATSAAMPAAQASPTASASTAMPAAPATSSNVGSGPQPAATHKPPSVMHAQFTSGISNREPADDVTTLDSSHDKVFFFTELKDADGRTVTHRWEFNGKTVAEVKLEPKADHWRTWSSKMLLPDQTGTWTVEVVDGDGNVLMSKSFDYTQAPMSDNKATHKPPAMQSTQTPASMAATNATPPPTF